MKPISLLLAACLALLPLASFAKKGPMYAVPAADKGRADLATLVLPEEIDIEMVDGFNYPGFHDLFRRGDIQVKILPGEREVALQYNQLYEWDAGQHEVVKSAVIVVGFTAQPGKTYRVEHVKFRNVEEARKGVENFVVHILDDQGKNQVFGASQVNRNWKGEETVMKRTDLAAPDAAAAALATRAATAAPVAGAAAAAAAAPVDGMSPAPAASVAAPSTPVTAVDAGPLDQMKSAWQRAGEADRAAFRAWLSTQK